ncbi:hypothetical protein HY357_03660 [Candidatus Roizmanbacteria bacterium]|nr:hypothetical protein [Candidatus Roizmanbacteria bacterium]
MKLPQKTNLAIGWSNDVVNFLIAVFFVTNIWIILYNTVLTFLTFLNPPVLSDQLLQQNISFPNPFKIPLYLSLSTISVLLIWLYYRFSPVFLERRQHNNGQAIFLLKLVLSLFLILLFLSKIGSYPMASNPYPYEIRADKSIYTTTLILYLFTLIFITIESIILYRISKINKFLSLLFFVCVIVIIAFLVFEARFPLSGLDYSFFFGPILEIAKGKTIYTDIRVQHGFLSILLFTLLYKINVLKLAYLPAIIWLLYVVQYFLCFYLILKVSRSIVFSFIGIFSIITINYFSLYHLPIWLPQTGPMRWLPSIFSIVLLYRFKKIDNKYLIFSIALLSLWLVDSGIYLILGYLFTLFLFFLTRIIDLKTVIKSILNLFGSILGVIFLINIIHIMFGYKIINLLNAFNSLKKYASLGIAQLPIESHSYFWLVMLLYFACIIYFFKKVHERQKLNDWGFEHLMLFSANLMFFASLYYLGRAHPHSLLLVSTLPLLIFFLLLGTLLTQIRSTKAKSIIMTLLFCLLIVYPAFMRQITLTEMIIVKLKRLTGGQIFQPELDEILYKKFNQDLELIRNNLPEDKITIIDNDDTYLFYLTGKKNLLNADPQIGIDTKEDLQHATQNFTKDCPKKIAVDCAVYNRCSQSLGFNQSGYFISSIILSEIEKKCAITYRPIECTNQLCIATAK